MDVQRIDDDTRRRPRISGGKVLYLDYDGVLHHEDVRWRLRIGAYMNVSGCVLFEHAKLLDELLRPYQDLVIVLSTSWVRRYGCSATAKRLPPGLRQRVVGATFHSQMNRYRFEALSRGRQVMEDVERRKPDSWFALDDTDEGWPLEVRDRVVITDEKLGISPPDVLARIQANLDRMYAAEIQINEQCTDVVVGTVVGRGPDVPYVLVETSDENQFAVTKKIFAGDWHALKRSDVVELVTTTKGAVTRVLSARILE